MVLVRRASVKTIDAADRNFFVTKIVSELETYKFKYQNLPLATNPSLPSPISRFLINQQGFYVDFGEHGQRMACSFATYRNN